MRIVDLLKKDAIILKEAFTGTKIEGRKEFEKLSGETMTIQFGE